MLDGGELRYVVLRPQYHSLHPCMARRNAWLTARLKSLQAQSFLSPPHRQGLSWSAILLPIWGLCCMHRRKRLNTHTHIRLTALFPGLPGWASTRKVKPIWILLRQKTVSGNGISWSICMSAPRYRQITTPAPTTQFLQTGCPSCCPTNSLKALKG